MFLAGAISFIWYTTFWFSSLWEHCEVRQKASRLLLFYGRGNWGSEGWRSEGAVLSSVPSRVESSALELVLWVVLLPPVGLCSVRAGLLFQTARGFVYVQIILPNKTCKQKYIPPKSLFISVYALQFIFGLLYLKFWITFINNGIAWEECFWASTVCRHSIFVGCNTLRPLTTLGERE